MKKRHSVYFYKILLNLISKYPLEKKTRREKFKKYIKDAEYFIFGSNSLETGGKDIRDFQKKDKKDADKENDTISVNNKTS